MSTTQIEAHITMTYADETTRAYTLPSIASAYAEDTDTMKGRIQAINNGTAQNVSDFRKTFVSAAGASFVSISAASMIETTEEVVYSG